MNRNAHYYEWLLPYLEGGLDDAQRAQMEARLGVDPALAAEAASLRRTLDGLRGAAARTPLAPHASVPPDLWPRLRARLEDRAKPAPARPAHGWWLAGVGATAVATLTLALFWLPGWHTPEIRDYPPPNPAGGQAPIRPPGPPAALSRPMTGTPRAEAPKPPAAAKTASPPKKAAILPPQETPLRDISGADPFALSPAPHSGDGSYAINGTQTSIRSPLAPSPAIRPAAPPPTNAASSEAASHLRNQLGNQAATTFDTPTPVFIVPQTPAEPSPPAPPVMARNQTQAKPGPALNVLNDAAVTTNAGAAAPPAPNPARGQAEMRTKPQVNGFYQVPLTTFGQMASPLHGARRDKSGKRTTAPLANAAQNSPPQGVGGGGFPGGNTFAGAVQAGLDAWQAALSAAVQPPLWGDTAGEQQANQALMAAQESGSLDDLRTRLEARRSQSPQDVVTGRMLATVYNFGFSSEAALRERRRIVGLDGAGGEDWFALAQAEERAGNGPAAKAAYRHALESPVPPSPFHTSIAKTRS